MDVTKNIAVSSDDELRQYPLIAGGDETAEEKSARETQEATDKAAADTAAAAAREADPVYWKEEGRKAFEARDRVKEENRLLQDRINQMQAAPPPPPPDHTAQDEQALNDRYWKEPAAVVRELISKTVEPLIGQYVAPFVEDRYELQVQKYATNPEFQKVKPQIDEMIRREPRLKQQPGIVDKLFNAARALNFNVEDERRRITEEVTAKLTGKTAAQLDGGGNPPPANTNNVIVNLSDLEKKTAEKFNPNLTPAEAYKAYAAKKVNWEKGVV